MEEWKRFYSNNEAEAFNKYLWAPPAETLSIVVVPQVFVECFRLVVGVESFPFFHVPLGLGKVTEVVLFLGFLNNCGCRLSLWFLLVLLLLFGFVVFGFCVLG